MKKSLYTSIMLGTAALGGVLAFPAVAQQGALTLEEIVVTARRREERLQDVPISMTVFNQQQLNDANIINASDLSTYTPSLYANERFGSDSSTFAIRGFSQELRTTSSVGVYFAEVVAPRGANITQSGDGAGPGDFFDLENVQVLKGPQGTLFGRNTTGGAVLLMPKKPTEEFEGYAEVSAGNYDMQRLQGVVNIPVSDSFRLRFGVDTQMRDGYLENVTDIGPSDFADIDYTAFRASAVWDITDTLENYTIVKYSESSNNGSPYSILACNGAPGADGRPLAFYPFCAADLAQRAAAGKDGFYDVASTSPRSFSDNELMQVINTTTWEVSDNLTVKNILSYAELETEQEFSLYGTNWNTGVLGVAPMPWTFQLLSMKDGMPIAHSKTFVEEFQLQGTAMDDRLTWQAGLYYEKTEPKEDYGSQTPSQIFCDLNTINSTDPTDFRCNDILGALSRIGGAPAGSTVGSLASSPGGVEYTNQAIYLQGTYDLTEELTLTLGLRYTDDETEGYVTETTYYFPGDPLGGLYSYEQAGLLPPPLGVNKPNPYTEYRTPTAKSEEPTWLIGLDYKPSADLLVYGKYARGYRQGSVNLASVAALAVHGPEQVDTYEVGFKSSFGDTMPATLNMSLFYNDFTDQQIQQGYFRTTGVGTTSILNAGSSTIWGLEADGTLQVTDNLTLSGSYAYLDTEVDDLTLPFDPTDQAALIDMGIAFLSGLTAEEGEPLSFAPEHKLVLTARYLLPVDEALGDMSLAATYVYNDDMQAVSKATSAYAVLPSYEVVNLNFNWDHVAGGPVDLSVFATNLFDEEYITYLTGNWTNGFEAIRTGAPRMYGMRLRYNF